MAPEQHRGAVADPRSDQFAFCVALFEAEVAAAVRAAFSGTGLGSADSAYEEVARRLDAYAANLRALETETCEATFVTGERPREQFDREMQCLNEGRERLDAVARGFVKADPDVVGNATTAVEALPDLASCTAPETLPARPPAAAGRAEDRAGGRPQPNDGTDSTESAVEPVISSSSGPLGSTDGEGSVHVSAPEPNLTPPSAAVLLAEETSRLQGYTEIGEPVARQLTHMEAIRVEAERGFCYKLAFALEPNAELSQHARSGMRIETRVLSDLREKPLQTTVAHNMPLRTRSFTAALGCPQEGGSLIADLQVAVIGDVGGHDFGDGEMLVQLLRRAISEAELATRVPQGSEAEVRAAAEREAKARAMCEKCALELWFCSKEEDVSRCAAYMSCLAGAELSPEACGK